MNPLGAVYGRVAGLRRRWYARRPERRQTLRVPVISVGNLVVGGSGKTPVTAALAELLLDAGEHPAILSRGYRRRTRADKVVVVSDGTRVLASVHESGDEPQMLARMLDGVPVVVCARRYRAGELAVARFGSTVLLLDDGFQHLELARDVDLLIVSPADLEEQVLPAGSLREPLESARMADAVLAPAPIAGRGARSRAYIDGARRVAASLGVDHAFAIETRFEPVRAVMGAPELRIPDPPSRVVAVAGIARPQRFFDTVRSLGWDVAEQMVFRDHHWFDQRDVARVEAAVKASGADGVITTEKDAVRLAGVSLTLPWAYLPLRVTLAPEEQFRAWIADRIQHARARIEGRRPGPLGPGDSRSTTSR